MLATGPARTRRAGGAHARVGLTGPGASREGYEAIPRAVLAIASGVIVLRYRNRRRAPAEPS